MVFSTMLATLGHEKRWNRMRQWDMSSCTDAYSIAKKICVLKGAEKTLSPVFLDGGKFRGFFFEHFMFDFFEFRSILISFLGGMNTCAFNFDVFFPMRSRASRTQSFLVQESSNTWHLLPKTLRRVPISEIHLQALWANAFLWSHGGLGAVAGGTCNAKVFRGRCCFQAWKESISGSRLWSWKGFQCLVWGHASLNPLFMQHSLRCLPCSSGCTPSTILNPWVICSRTDKNRNSRDSWGDELTLMACSHLLRRETSVITDSSDASNHTLTFSPPEIISKDLWKERLTICCLPDRHYDSTAAAWNFLPSVSEDCQVRLAPWSWNSMSNS